MEKRIRKAIVIGSGVMGAGIAAHLANVGIQVHLLDIVLKDKPNRNQLAEAAKQNLLKQKPSPVYTRESLDRITPGNIEDDLHLAATADWIIEAITEKLSLKQQLLQQVEGYWKPGTIVSSNTSGISIQRMVEGRSKSFRKHFLGTHFFNPPRYMKLLEMIPTADTDPELLSYMIRFSEKVLGKGVVQAKDTPNFIANRIGVYGLLTTLSAMDRYGLSVADVDALTGLAIGRPKSATFRTLDMVGLDTFIHVAANVHQHVSSEKEKEKFIVPEILHYMVENGCLGDKNGQGFYKKVKGPGGKEILQIDPKTRQYVAKQKGSFPSLEASKRAKSLQEKLQLMAYGKDPGSLLVWDVLKHTLLYSAQKIPEISDSLYDIDQAMKWGFNWELGPFEVWDAIGLQKSIARMEEEGDAVPKWVKEIIAQGNTSFYEKTAGATYYLNIYGEKKEILQSEKRLSLSAIKEEGRIIKRNAGATLLDLGDDVACLEFHSPNQAIGPDMIQMTRYALEEVKKNYRGLVIGSQAKNFCVGANLMMLLMEAQDQNWFEIEQMVRDFQTLAMAMKYSEKPVVAAPYGMTLGGGVELCLPTSHVVAAAETYMGLVEVGVGLIPGGAGTKEMLWRTTNSMDIDGKVDLQPHINRIFETIAMAKVSTSGEEAKELQYLRPYDSISINQDYLLYEAKQRVLALSAANYQPPASKLIRVVGEPGLAVMKLGVYQLKMGGYISDHDAKIAQTLAHVLSGGNLPANSRVSEAYLLDLEREAFLSLCGEPKSQARMHHMLVKGKPLRN